MTKQEIDNYWKAVKAQSNAQDLGNYFQFGVGQRLQNQYGEAVVKWRKVSIHKQEFNQLRNLQAFLITYNVYLPEGFDFEKTTVAKVIDAIAHEGNAQRIFVLHNPTETAKQKKIV
jgi:hypothetical protein